VGKVIRDTFSVCPICLERVPARRVRTGDEVRLEKTCPVHGDFSVVVWRGKVDHDEWLGGAPAIAPGENEACPTACGLCGEHLQDTCCILLEVTSRCNLSCRFCFAGGGDAHDPTTDPPPGRIREWLSRVVRPGKSLVHLSGGEPTLRDDLPQLVAICKELGCKYVQVNTNGIRLARDEGYVKALAEAGLSFVFMQFDGTEDGIYEALRGRPLLATKKRAISNCALQNIGITLVPTLVPGVNTQNIGDILRYAVKSSPAVRGVHFQPVSFFGRIPAAPRDEDRFTLDELLLEIEEQAGELIGLENLAPSQCNHPFCGFHGDFVVMPSRLVPLTRRGATAPAGGAFAGAASGSNGCCCGSVQADRNREFIGRRWTRPRPDGAGHAACCGTGTDLGDMEYFLRRVKSHGFTVTAMAFQDAGNLDLERLRRCSLHVCDAGRLIPFCSYYLSAWQRA